MTVTKEELTLEIVKLMEQNRELSRQLRIADDQIDWMSEGFDKVIQLIKDHESDTGKLPLRISFALAAAKNHNTWKPQKRGFMESIYNPSDEEIEYANRRKRT